VRARADVPRVVVPPLGALLLVGAAIAAPRTARASGFHVDEQDAAATGRSGAVIAHATNASSIYYNPAGMAELHGLQLQLGGTAVRPTAEFTPAEGGEKTKANPDTFVLPQLFASWRADTGLLVSAGAEHRRKLRRRSGTTRDLRRDGDGLDARRLRRPRRRQREVLEPRGPVQQYDQRRRRL